MSSPDPNDRPTVLIYGSGEPMLDAFLVALNRYAHTIDEPGDSPIVPSVLTSAPDLTVLVGDAAGADAEKLIAELNNHALTRGCAVALLSDDAGLQKRLDAERLGALAVVPRTASADGTAQKLVELASIVDDEAPVPERGALGEASVDELVSILGQELRSGILSVSQEGKDGPAASFVVSAGQPMRDAIADFVQRIRPLVAESKPLTYEFHEARTGQLTILDDRSDDGSREDLRDRRLLLIANNPAHADALSQEMRANGATVVVAAADGSGWSRAHDLDPEIALIDEDGLNGWGYDAVARLRKDPQLRWASLLVMTPGELLPEGEAPRVDRLAANVAGLMKPEKELAKRAARGEAFDARLEAMGPTRLLRTLLSTGTGWRVTVRPELGVSIRVGLVEGLIAGADAKLANGEELAGPAALSALLVAGSGRVRVEPITHADTANLLMPLDSAVRLARAEQPRRRRSRPPSALPKRRRTSEVPPDSTLVGELRSLVSELRTALEQKGSAPASVASKHAPGYTSTLSGAPAPTDSPEAPRPPKPSPPVRAAAKPKPPKKTPPPAPRATPKAAGSDSRGAGGTSTKPARSVPPPPPKAARMASKRPPPAVSGKSKPRGATSGHRRSVPPPPVSSALKKRLSEPPPSPLSKGAGGAAATLPATPSKVTKSLAKVVSTSASASRPKPGPARKIPTTAPPPAVSAVAASAAGSAATSTPPPPPPPATRKSKPPAPPSPSTGAMPVAMQALRPSGNAAEEAALELAGEAPTPAPASARFERPVERALPPESASASSAQPVPGAAVNHHDAADPSAGRTPMGRLPLIAAAASLGLLALVGIGWAVSHAIGGDEDAAADDTSALAVETGPATLEPPTPSMAPTPAPAPEPAPTPTPTATTPTPPPAATAQEEGSRLPVVDPGPMPGAHAGEAALRSRYTQSVRDGRRALARGNLEVALRHYRMAVHLKPRSIDALAGMATVYLDAGQPRASQPWSARAQAIDGEDERGALLAGDALWALGERAAALRTWRTLDSRASRSRIERAEETIAEEALVQ